MATGSQVPFRAPRCQGGGAVGDAFWSPQCAVVVRGAQPGHRRPGPCRGGGGVPSPRRIPPHRVRRPGPRGDRDGRPRLGAKPGLGGHQPPPGRRRRAGPRRRRRPDRRRAGRGRPAPTSHLRADPRPPARPVGVAPSRPGRARCRAGSGGRSTTTRPRSRPSCAAVGSPWGRLAGARGLWPRPAWPSASRDGGRAPGLSPEPAPRSVRANPQGRLVAPSIRTGANWLLIALGGTNVR